MIFIFGGWYFDRNLNKKFYNRIALCEKRIYKTQKTAENSFKKLQSGNNNVKIQKADTFKDSTLFFSRSAGAVTGTDILYEIRF